MNSILNFSLIQTNLVWENQKENIALLSEKLLQIPENTDVVVLPEMFTTGFSMTPEKFLGENLFDTLAWMKKKSVEINAVLVGSTIVYENDSYFNRLFWVRPDGGHRYYDKRHLFTLAGEDRKYKAGNKRVVVEIKGWKIFLQTCYDLRFPVWAKNTENYDVLVNVANWPAIRSDAWKLLLPARAIENQCFVVAVNRVGEDGNGKKHSGDTAVYNFEGAKIASAPAYTEAIVNISLDRTLLDSFRKKFTFLNDSDAFEVKV